MQRQKFNTLGGLNIQSTWCLECDSYMHTSSIAFRAHGALNAIPICIRQALLHHAIQIGRLSILHEEGVDYS